MFSSTFIHHGKMHLFMELFHHGKMHPFMELFHHGKMHLFMELFHHGKMHETESNHDIVPQHSQPLNIPKCPRQLSKALNTFNYEFTHWSDVLRFYRSSDGCIVSTLSIADLPTAGGEPSRMQRVLYQPSSSILITQRARLAG
jgi:hypothetical protein